MTTSPPSDNDRARVRATLIGALAILIWASLAVLTATSGAMAPFQMVAIAFAVAAGVASVYGMVRGEGLLKHARQPLAAWVVGVGGLFGYHVLVFLALKTAPALEANLINYLWPLLIVLFSALLPGERLRWWHVAGTLAGLLGTVLILTGGSEPLSFSGDAWPGYLAAFAAALTWSGYSVLNRRFAHVPTQAVGPFLWVASALAVACHLAFETTVWPAGAWEWFAIVALGLGPAGGVFFVWDYGVKHGDIRVLGGLAYTTPLMSTALLVLFGQGSLTPATAAAAGLIICGAVLASKDLLFARRKAKLD